MNFRATIVVLVICVWVETGVCQCPRGSGLGFYSHAQQCDVYYECRNGTQSEVLCPDGLVFNQERSHKSARCDYPTEVDCAQRPYLQQAKPSAHCPRKWGLFPHEEDCGKFWNCVDGAPYGFECPIGLAFNEGRSNCDWADQVDRCDAEAMLGFQCPQPGPGFYSQNELGHYAHSTDCRKHYICVFGTDDRLQPRLFACDEGQVFNAETSLCDKPANVAGCENYYGALNYANDDDENNEDPNFVEAKPSPVPVRRRRPNNQNRRN